MDRRYAGPKSRRDALNPAVWSFTTIKNYPYPQAASNPNPEHSAEGVSLGLENVS